MRLVALSIILAAGATARAQSCPQSSEADRARCFTSLALTTGDASWCADIEGETEREACQTSASRRSGETRCDGIENEFARADCYQAGAIGTAERARREALAEQAASDRAVARAQLDALDEQLRQAEEASAAEEEERALLEAQLEATRRTQALLEEVAAERSEEDAAAELEAAEGTGGELDATERSEEDAAAELEAADRTEEDAAAEPQAEAPDEGAPRTEGSEPRAE